MTEAITETSYYFLVVHGIPLDWFSGVAYRRAASFTTQRQKVIKCPYCGKMLTSIDAETKVDIYCYPKRPERMVNCHEYKKCHACRETVGIYFAPE